jgi:hypothetical protein
MLIAAVHEPVAGSGERSQFEFVLPVDVEAMMKIATALCAVMVLLFSYEHSAAQRRDLPPEPK